MTPRPLDTVGFAERVLTLLDLGNFTATYKYAVMLALMDLCLEGTSRSGTPPLQLTTRQLALKVLELYWPQARPIDPGKRRILLQNRGGQARILNRILRFKEGREPGLGFHQARVADPRAFERLVDDVEWVLVFMPLPKLQRVGGKVDEFIYHISWNDHISRREWRNLDDHDNQIHLVPEAAENLVRLSGLLRPLLQRQWSDMVARLNRDLFSEASLDEFLFGIPRRDLHLVRGRLRELQDDRCFYCGERLSNSPEVDHFIPWSRYPDNGIDNLVVAHARCNRHKSNHLAATEHLGHWRTRADEAKGDLESIAESTEWERNTDRTHSVVRGIYLSLPGHLRLWKVGDEFEEADQRILTRILAA